jgi:pilus assembly protein CpaF
LEIPGIYETTIKYFLEPIWDLIEDETVSELLVNGPDQIYAERRGKLTLLDRSFSSSEKLMAAVKNIAQFSGKRIDSFTNEVEARLPDGSRVHVVFPPAARQGISMSIRKFSRNTFTLETLINNGSVSPPAREFLEIVTMIGKNLIVSGGTGSGKTSLLNAISRAIPGNERIVVIEDSCELQLQQEHLVNFEVRRPDYKGRGGFAIRDLFKSSLRMRPDRIVIGEIRGGEAIDMLQAMNSGHSGSMSTIHANSPRDALSRLETLALMGGIEIPLSAVRNQVAAAIDVVVQTSRMLDGSRKVTHISEVMPLTAEGNYVLQDIFIYRITGRDAEGKLLGELVWTGRISEAAEELKSKGFDGQVALTGEIFGLKQDSDQAIVASQAR